MIKWLAHFRYLSGTCHSLPPSQCWRRGGARCDAISPIRQAGRRHQFPPPLLLSLLLAPHTTLQHTTIPPYLSIVLKECGRRSDCDCRDPVTREHFTPYEAHDTTARARSIAPRLSCHQIRSLGRTTGRRDRGKDNEVIFQTLTRKARLQCTENAISLFHVGML